jgi:hypothetical protein
MDALSSSHIDDKIAWYENDGSLNFTEKTISTAANAARSVFAVDLDGDYDMDVLSASLIDDKIAWYENNGSESFTAHTISTAADGATCVYACDIEGDGDVDVLSASLNDDKIAWYENNGSESFTERIISTSADLANRIYAADLNGDGNIDVLSASANDDKIAWYENSGSGKFMDRVITTSADQAADVFAADIDGDGSMDVLSASAGDDKVTWYKNTRVYTLTYEAGPNGSLNGPTPQTVAHGGNGAAVEAIPDAEYRFVDWSDGETMSKRTDRNVISDIDVTANFEENVHTLTYTAGSNGTISGTSPQTVAHGSNGTAVEAVPNTGYHFVDWSDGSTANPRTDQNVTEDISVTANFEINSYTLTYTAGPNGSISGTNPQTVTHGSNGTAVEAVASTGYHFVDWSDGSTNNPRADQNVTKNISVTANFEINSYTLTYTAGPNGSLVGTTPQTVTHGSNGTAIEAVPGTGYHFIDWSDGSAANPRIDSVITEDISVTANFAINTYTLTYTNGPNGSISGTNPQTVTHGSNGESVGAIADSGYHFVNWSDGSTTNPRVDSNVTADISVTANFDANTAINEQDKVPVPGAFGITAVPNPVNMGNGTIDIIVNAGANAAEVHLAIFDALGNRVFDRNSTENIRNAYQFRWNLQNVNGRPFASGTYKALALVKYKDGSVKKFTALVGVKK